MATANNTPITIEATVQAPVEKVWELWSGPAHITKWAYASDEWHAPYADNDLRTGGKFKTTMAAKDGSFGFDFEGIYTDVQKHELIAYTLLDDRKVKITFSPKDGQTRIIETFEAEQTNPIEMQRAGWQAILDNFKKYAEENG